MRINFAIKKMLILLVSVSVTVIFILSATGFSAFRMLAGNQAKFVEKVLPLNFTIKRIGEEVSEYIFRLEQADHAKTIAEFVQVSNRTDFEQTFKSIYETLVALSTDMPDARQEIEKLAAIYTHFLQNDSLLNDAVYQNFKLADAIALQITKMDEVEAALQENAEIISGKINFIFAKKNVAMQRDVKNKDDISEVRQAINEFMVGDILTTQRGCNELRVTVASLPSYGRQLLLTNDADAITSIRDNKIAQAITLSEGSLATLKEMTVPEDNLLARIKKIEDDFIRMKLILIDSDNSIANLRSQWLHQQKRISEMSLALTENISLINVRLSNLNALGESITKSAQGETTLVSQTAGGIIVFVSVAAVLCMLFTGFMLVRRIITPLNLTTKMLRDIGEGEGDLTKRLGTCNMKEIDEMAHWFNLFVEKLQKLVKDILDKAMVLSQSSEELTATAAEMDSNAEGMSYQAGAVSSATEEMSLSVEQISAGAEEMSISVSSVAAAIEEMSNSLKHVSQNAAKGSEIATDANKQAKLTNDVMRRLNLSAAEITKVLDSINDIADQTKLLALNATIEAASAGEAGKGFAVVANEVKELAKQTAQATVEIERRIEEMKENTGNAVTTIDHIVKVIAELDNIALSIAKSVEDQSSTTNDISQNVGDASKAAMEIANNVSEVSKGAYEVSEKNHAVKVMAEKTASGTAATKASADAMAETATLLHNLVAQFKV